MWTHLILQPSSFLLVSRLSRIRSSQARLHWSSLNRFSYSRSPSHVASNSRSLTHTSSRSYYLPPTTKSRSVAFLARSFPLEEIENMGIILDVWHCGDALIDGWSLGYWLDRRRVRTRQDDRKVHLGAVCRGETVVRMLEKCYLTGAQRRNKLFEGRTLEHPSKSPKPAVDVTQSPLGQGRHHGKGGVTRRRSALLVYDASRPIDPA
jgi:hypothetical protein